MTNDEKAQLFFEMKAERDRAKGDLCLARKKAGKLIRSLRAAQLSLSGEVPWSVVEGRLHCGQANAPVSGSFPAEADIVDTLETIRDCQKSIDDYDAFVR